MTRLSSLEAVPPSWRWSLSLRQRLMLGLLLLLLSTSGGLGWMATQRATSALIDQVEQTLPLMAQDAARLVSSRIETQLGRLSELARREMLIEAGSAGKMAFLEASSARLGYLGMGWVDRQGVAHYPDGTTADLAQRDYIQRAFAGEANISEVLISRVINRPVIMLAAPIEHQGEVVAVLIARMDATLLSDITDDLGLGEQGSAFMLNQRGELIASPDRERVMAQERPMEALSATDEVNREAYRRLLAEDQLVVQMTGHTGRQWVGAVRLPERGWVLAVVAQEEEVLAGLVALRWTLLLTTLIFTLVGAVFAFWLSLAIIRPVRQVARTLEEISQGDGDLTVRLPVQGRDEITELSQHFNHFVGKIEMVVADVKASVSTITIAAQEIAAGNADLSERTEEQASSLEETASSLEELTATVKHNAEHAGQAKQLAMQAHQNAVKGGEQSQQAIQMMEAISSSSAKIADITSLIDSIAFQTNILALNAAVEAARAGEQGRGFAVVAAEVRALAQRSAAATKDIKQLIDASVAQVEQGRGLVDATGDTIAATLGSVKQVSQIMSEISAASVEQSQGIEQVNQAVLQMDNVTQQNAALVEEAAAAAESLEEQAVALREAVASFTVSASIEQS
ncbi:methyl-accepting chemotaxis protein [Marinospirillum sp. MEB164]|uniref:Methyl-accepting chemotaxis protein n=1 Tax=Marinospirillum alkalitolerans TaxID=3123374 RepID=A0ABW8PYJ3_9GAMM